MSGLETTMGGTRESFPSTLWTVVREAADAQGGRESLERLLAQYWRPVYAYLRRRWGKSIEDAKDLTQGFLEELLEGNALRQARPSHGSFRAYLRASLDHYVIDENRAARAQKRGGSLRGLDIAELTDVLPASEESDPAKAFDQEWIATTLERGLKELEIDLNREGKPKVYEAFRSFYLSDASQPQVAEELGLKVSDVNNYLVEARRRLRIILRRAVREYVSSPAGEDQELEFLLGE